ncbi:MULTISPECIES: hypothetical protein [unclassified Cellulophaga]|uniref:hypothetical protein n=1 Tax=unclassified Cellulophaga TaxID=2634405 RepID=UPI0026E2DA3D|nr:MULTISPECIES: hypothetical protein [unclassified Cellulophaga]MDO6490858.1 hypothetical protein [Cellulophaga sp. 2_MG-2023]MDO6493948.1 hypothetical protein [Cellulophaga sp. 3_MG-2023]
MNIGFKEIVISLLVLLVILFYTVKSKYMLSEKMAAKNLNTFLKANYGSTLKYTDLYRFFNTATMNPNCFKAVIYEVENPKIEMHLTFDASKIADQKDVKSMYPDGLSFHQFYIQKQEVVASQTIIDDKMLAMGVSLEWSYDLVILTFDKEYSETEITHKEQCFLDLFSKEDTDKFGYYHSFNLKLMFLNDTYASLTHYIEKEESVWVLKDIKLNEDEVSFNKINEDVKAAIHKYLKETQPKLILSNYFGTLVNKSDFNRVIWVEYTEEKRTKIEIEEAKKGVYVSPINGYVVVYWNIYKKQAQHIAFMPLKEHLTRVEILEIEKEKLL